LSEVKKKTLYCLQIFLYMTFNRLSFSLFLIKIDILIRLEMVTLRL
jgi:hypothetical protein